MKRPAYPSDLTDAQWQLVEPFIPPPKPGGRPRTIDPREVLNAIFYLLRTGCQWRFIPHEFPCWSTVHCYYRTWRLDGTWQRLHDALRDQLRTQEGREVSPSAALVDSQSVKTTEKGGPQARLVTTPARK
jgi:putative transposase